MRKAGLCFWVVTPRLTTSAGRRDKAWETRFCTSTCALLGSVPGRNVIVICNVPSEPATDFMYIMPSAPLICSSNGADTVSAMTLGLAPGYVALTTTVGGTTSGYSLMGSNGTEIRPATRMTIDNTAAKIGRSMKNLEKSMCVLPYLTADATTAAGGDANVPIPTIFGFPGRIRAK